MVSFTYFLEKIYEYSAYFCLCIAPFSLLVINILKYIFLPHYRFQLSQKKLHEKADSIINFNNSVYKSYKDGKKIPQYELQMKTNAAFGTKIYPYKLIFLLFDRDVVDIEQKAKDLLGLYFLLDIDYERNKILPPAWLHKNSLIWIFIFSMTIYTIISVLLILSITVLKETFVNTTWFMIFLFSLLFINVLVIMTVARLKAVSEIIDW